jgi:hypothetical protein
MSFRSGQETCLDAGPPAGKYLRGLPYPPSEQQLEARIPGVRQLLQQHYSATSALRHHFPSHSQENRRDSVAAITHAVSADQQPIQRRSSEDTIASFHPGGINTFVWRGQPNPAPAMIPGRESSAWTAPVLQSSAPGLSQSSFIQEMSATPRTHKHSPLQPPEAAFPNSHVSRGGLNDVGPVHDIRGHPNLHDAFSDYESGQLRAYYWHEVPSQSDWGRTKAGKPRKRLAQACLSCRQKKIRCHPTPYRTKCDQCEKTDVDCKFESGWVT